MHHAIMVMAHDNSYTLFENIKLLDSPYTDIYIHVDKKFRNFNYLKITSEVFFSNVYFINNRIDVKWGGYSQIASELLLMDTAFQKRRYDYYHLISGSDLLLHPISYLNKFCAENQGKIFLDCQEIDNDKDFRIYQRAAVPHILVPYFNVRNRYVKLGSRILDRVQANFRSRFMQQDMVKKNHMKLFFGANWFSLPEDAVKFVLNNQNQINSLFKRGRNVDELFVQTILANNDGFREKMVGSRRFTDWSAGGDHPKTLTMADFDCLSESSAFFARKFDDRVDKEVIDRVVCKVKSEM